MELVKAQKDAALVESLIVKGDLAKLTTEERNRYYVGLCEMTGLNPLSQPFEYINLSGKLVLYAKKAATDQLRTVRSISVYKTETKLEEDYYTVTAYAKALDTGREDSDIGSVFIGGLRGEARANAMMKAMTKAKRRVTLSICGLGMLDETEIESIPSAKAVDVPKPGPIELKSESETVVVADELGAITDGMLTQAQRDVMAAMNTFADKDLLPKIKQYVNKNWTNYKELQSVLARLTKKESA